MNAIRQATKVEERQRISHSPLLDLLRAAAAILVLFGHTRNWIFLNIASVHNPTIFLKFFWLISVLEHEAVVIFFVLSGYLVGGSIMNAIQKKSFDLLNYIIARFARIYIVYIPAMALTAIVFWVGNATLRDFGGDTMRPFFENTQPNIGGVHQILCHMAGLQGYACPTWRQNPVLWSLGYEWSIYLFAPAILGFALKQGNLFVRLLGIGLIVCGSLSLSVEPKEWLFWLCTWFLGTLAARVSKTINLPMALGLFGLVLAISAMAFSRLKIVDVMLTDVVIAIGIALAIACRSLVSFSLFPRFFGWAAGFSYSLYATHLPLVFLMIALFQNLGYPTHKIPPGLLAFEEFLACTLVSILAAYIFSIFTERKTDQLRAWLKNRVGTPV